METKKWYQSKIIWINVISVLIEVGNLLMTNPIIPQKFAGVLSLGIAVLTIVFRKLGTTKTIE